MSLLTHSAVHCFHDAQQLTGTFCTARVGVRLDRTAPENGGYARRRVARIRRISNLPAQHGVRGQNRLDRIHAHTEQGETFVMQSCGPTVTAGESFLFREWNKFPNSFFDVVVLVRNFKTKFERIEQQIKSIHMCTKVSLKQYYVMWDILWCQKQ